MHPSTVQPTTRIAWIWDGPGKALALNHGILAVWDGEKRVSSLLFPNH